MKLNNTVYDVLKYLGTIVLPAVAVAYQSLAQVWNLPFPDEIPNTILICVTLLNTCLQISSTAYYKDQNTSKDKEAVETVEGEG